VVLLILFAIVPVGFTLITSEYLWRKKIIKGERARKFIHVLAGTWMAFWPHYLTFRMIAALGAVIIAVLIYSRITRLFHAIYAVKRRTYGDILYGVAIVLCALIALEPWIFTTAILYVAVADGGAAVAGRFYGIKNTYYVFGLKNLRKSIAGTGAFIVLAYASLLVGYFVGGKDALDSSFVLAFTLLPLGAAILENTTPYGLDNMITPLFVTLLLNTLV
jgi:dolichol kinase